MTDIVQIHPENVRLDREVARIDGEMEVLATAVAGKAPISAGITTGERAKLESAVQPDELAIAIGTRATAAQGLKADTAVQPAALTAAISQLDANLAAETGARESSFTALDQSKASKLELSAETQAREILANRVAVTEDGIGQLDESLAAETGARESSFTALDENKASKIELGAEAQARELLAADLSDRIDGVVTRPYPDDRDGPINYGVLTGQNGHGLVVDLETAQPVLSSLSFRPNIDRDGAALVPVLAGRNRAAPLAWDSLAGAFLSPPLLMRPALDRDGGGALISSISDRQSRAPYAYDTVRGGMVMGPILRRASGNRDGGVRSALIEGLNGRATIAYDEAEAGTLAPPLVRRRSVDRDLGNHSWPLVQDRFGRSPIAWDEIEEAVDLRLNRDARARIEYHSPTEFLGPHRAFNVRVGKLFRYASVQEADGYVGDVRQRLSGSTAAIADTGDNIVDLIQYQGQSNAGDGSISGQLLTGTPAPRHLIVTNGWYGYGDNAVPAPPATLDFSGLPMPSYPNATGQLPAALMAMAAYDLDRRATDRRVAPMSVATNWRGSDQIDKFFPATSGRFNHENALEQARQARAVARLYGCALRHDFVFVQGEAGAVGDYYTSLVSYLDTVVPIYGSNKGSGDAAYKVFLLQTNSASSGAAYDAAALAQLRVARERYAAGVTTLASPMYDGPLEDQAGPDIHGSVLGRMIIHERVALAREFVRRKGVPFHPTWPVAGGMTVSGNVVTVPISLATGALALALDTDRVAPVDNYGFVWSRSGGGGPTISSVAISGTSILITLSGPPASGDKLRYALDNTNPLEGWAGGRGQIYATTNVPSPFAVRGFAVPATIRQPLVRFEETLP